MKLLYIALLFVSQLVLSDPITTITFDNLADSTQVAGAYPGVTFTNALVQSQNISLSPAYSPPFSPPNAVTNDSGDVTKPGGSMIITLASPVPFVAGYFDYSEQLTLTALDATSSTIASKPSLFSSNVKGSGNPQNEFISVGSVNGPSTIKSIQISTASLQSDTFTLDNFEYGAPEPATISMLATGGLFLGLIAVRSVRSCSEQCSQAGSTRDEVS